MRFAVSGVAALIVVGVFMAYSSKKIGLETAIRDARRTTLESAEGIIEPVLTDPVADGDASALKRLDDAVRKNLLRGSLVRIKIWNAKGTIVYSDDSRLVGRQFELDEHEAAIFDGRDAVAHVSDLSAPENQFETDKKLLEVYVLSSTREGTPLLIEAYFRYGDVSAAGRDLWWRFAPIALGSLIAIELIQIPLAWRLARRLRTQEAHGERLMGHAIEASSAERRRIVSDLHDGVVQDLIGVSLTLSAASMENSKGAHLLDDAAKTIRESVQSLRSLLVDIYPPNLADDGIESALLDLLAKVADRKIATSLKVDLHGIMLDQNTSKLLYRSAQEALRNVIAHARATTVQVDLTVDDDLAIVTIDDNGQGFERPQWEEQVERGHFGLRALSALVRESGGQISIRSTTGLGTRVIVELPLSHRRPRSQFRDRTDKVAVVAEGALRVTEPRKRAAPRLRSNTLGHAQPVSSPSKPPKVEDLREILLCNTRMP